MKASYSPCRARIGFLSGLPEMAIGLVSFYHRSKNLTLICDRKLNITGKLLPDHTTEA
jgi:hypothetical protein